MLDFRMFNFNKITIIAVILILIILSISLPNFLLGKKVKVARVTQRKSIEAVYATGSVESLEMVPVAVRTSGRLKELLVDEGSEVEANQLLARLEDQDLQHKLSELELKEKLSFKEHERTASLYKKNAVSRQIFEQNQAQWQMAQEAKKNIEAQIRYLHLFAPKSGVVIKRDGEIGQILNLNQTVFWLSVSKQKRITAEVDEEDILKVKNGQEVLVQVDALTDKIFKGEVSSITPMGDPATRSYRVRIILYDAKELMIGMTAEANIIVKKNNKSLTIPSAALNAEGSVCQVIDNRLHLIKPKIGIFTEDQVEILSILKENDLAIIDKNFVCTNGKKVRVY
jgi:multidrug efflux system membrane fusion protein